MSTNDRPRTNRDSPGVRASHSSEEEPTAGFKSGVNPLYGSDIMGGDSASSQDVVYTPSSSSKHANKDGTRTVAATPTESTVVPGAGSTEASATRRSSSTHAKRPSARGSSPQSTLTASTSQSSMSSRMTPTSKNASHGSSKKSAVRVNAVKARSSRQENLAKGTGQAPLVPAQLAPVPPPPPKRKRARKPTGDVETGDAASEPTVLEDAPDKTLMEMLQSYLKKQDVYTRIVFIVVLLVLAGGALGAYVIMLVNAIQGKDPKYIALSAVFSLVLLWVVYKYCFSDQRLQDQSAIAQDIATLYAAIPDHTAIRGVSKRGRAQFTSFKYEKSEMLFTAVTDDGVSLGSERGSELMMEGADPSCPLCNVAYVEGSDLCLLPCLHVFHEGCIHKWCNRHIVCPLCKRHLEAPEPLHALPGASYGGSTVQSEPAGARYDAGGRTAWRHMLGSAAPGPSSGHGSSRGMGGTRSDDGLWNDRVLNAAQRQMRGRHNRVTSFSSETRRHNSARGRTGGPPQSSSAGASAMGRSQSINTSSARIQQGIQRTRSSSFSTANERGRAPGRVAHGTAPNRGGAGGATHRSGDNMSPPRATSDLGVGSRDANQALRATEDVLGRPPACSRSTFSDEGSGNLTDGGSSRKPSFVAVSSNKAAQMGGHSRGQGPAVITVRRVKTQPNGTAPTGTRHSRRPSGSVGRDSARSGGESESDVGGHGGGAERVFSSLGGKHHDPYPYDDDSPEEVTTKALTYGPRKPRVPSKKGASKEKGVWDMPGHRRHSSAGSTSAEESGSGRRPRRRSMNRAPPSKPGSGNHSGIASVAATAEAVTKLLTRSTQKDDQRFASSSSRGSNGGGRSLSSNHANPNATFNYNSAASEPESGADSGSDTMAEVVMRRDGGPGRRASSGARRHSHSGTVKTTPPTKTAPVTKGTPAPPMAAARVATWNSNASVTSAPAIDPSFSTSGDVADTENGEGDCDVDMDRDGDENGQASGGATESKIGSGSSGSSRSWSIRRPSLTGSGGEAHGESLAPAAGSGRRSQGSDKRSSVVGRLFGSSSAARIGMVPNGNISDSGHVAGYGSDSEDESKTEPLSESAGRSTTELIKTYETSRSTPEKAMALSDDPGSRSSRSSPPLARKRSSSSSKGAGRRRASVPGGRTVFVSDYMATTESEQDDEPIHRPKLSYKRNTASSNRRPKKFDEARAEEKPDADLPPVNPDGNDWGTESPYTRPKLSYGSNGASHSRKSSFGFDSAKGRKGRFETMSTGGVSYSR